VVKYRNECCGCASPMYPCIGDACPNMNVMVMVCDKCHKEVDYLHEGLYEDLCDDCYDEENGEIEND